MKAWRKEAAALKRFAIERGVHERGQRYGKLLRDSRTRVIKGDAPALFHVLVERFARHWVAEMTAELDRQQA